MECLLFSDFMSSTQRFIILFFLVWVDLFPLYFEYCLLITNAIQLCMEFKLCENPSDIPEQFVCLK